MELSIQPYRNNLYPIGGLFVRGNSLAGWLDAVAQLELPLEAVQIYPLPGAVANSIWGCLIQLPAGGRKLDAGKHSFCQLAENLLFMPVQSTLRPALGSDELAKILDGRSYAFHPETGWVLLEAPLDIQTHLQLPQPTAAEVRQPAKTVPVPMQVKSFQVHQPAPETMLEQMDKHLFPKRKELTDKPLGAAEKIKLFLLRSLFAPNSDDGKYSTAKGGKPNKFAEKMGRLLAGKWMDRIVGKLQQQYENLEERNQKMMDKLLDMFKNNPDEALKYAMPVDENGTSRGGQEGAFDLSRRWSDFSLLGSRSISSSGSAILGDSHLRRLINQYHSTADDLKKRKEYEKAAFVYLKLLKNPHLAAQTLEEGHLYGEAAAIYLTHCKDMKSAAACYERGRMTTLAIDLYKQLGQEEKVGDLYISINDRQNANYHYSNVADGYEQKQQYVKAAQLYKDKMAQTGKAQQLLLLGWRQGNDATACLENYFTNISAAEEKALVNAITTVYKDDTNAHNEVKFLQVIQNQHTKHTAAQDCTREIAYEIIARQATLNPEIVSELKAFNKADKNIVKDVLKYKQRRKELGNGA